MDPSLIPQVNPDGFSEDSPSITVALINCVGQSKLPIWKQLEIQSFVCTNEVDILHLQECKIDEDSFAQCGYLTSNFNIFSNNKPDESHYGTASLVRSDLDVTNIHTDDDGRVIVFDAAGSTWSNLYLPSGSDGNSRAKREHYFSEVIPQLMVRRLAQGAAGGDFNSIIALNDSTRNPHTKVSPSCRNLVRAFSWCDSFRKMYPRAPQYSRHSDHPHHGSGASRIDRSYHWGNLEVREAEYKSISFSDHFCLTIDYGLPYNLSRHLAPKTRPAFKISPLVVNDETFKARLELSMIEWLSVKDNGAEVLLWWEYLVKTGIKQLALARTKELKKQKMGKLNILKLRQVNLTQKVNNMQMNFLAELKLVNLLISEWYKNESSMIHLLSRSNDLNLNEKVRIYHHGQHQQFIKRSATLQLQTPAGIVTGHLECAKALEDNVTVKSLECQVWRSTFLWVKIQTESPSFRCWDVSRF
mgnify:FL=1